jgi:tetratricopeptide (TPR) repeat protein
MIEKYRHQFVLLGFTLLALLIYGKLLTYGYAVDDAYIFKYIPKPDAEFLAYLKIFGSRFEISDYRPMSYFIFGMEQYFFGEIIPSISHGINLVLYIILTYIVYRTVLLFPIDSERINIYYLAIFTGFIFLIHPIHTSVVANLKSRDGILSMIFLMLALIQLLKYIEDRRVLHLLYALLLNVLSMMSKADGMLFFSCAILLFLVYRKINPIVIAFCYVVFMLDFNWMYLMMKIIPATENISDLPVLFHENPVGANSPFTVKFAQGIQTYYWYLRFMIVPDYYFYYGYNKIPVVELFSAETLKYLLLNVILFGTAIYAWWKRTYIYMFGILFFYLMLVGFANIRQPVPGIIADRYAFIASFGFILSFSYLIFRIINKLFTDEKTVKFSTIGFALVFFILIFPYLKTQRDKWKDFPTLMNRDMPFLTESFDANRIAAVNYYKQANLRTDKLERSEFLVQSIKYAEQAVKIYDKNVLVKEYLGMAYKDYGDKFSAKKQFISNLEFCDTSYVSMEGLGDIYFMERDYKNAAMMYLKLVYGNPKYDVPYYKLSNTFAVSGNFQKCLAFNDTLIKQNKMNFVPYECKGYGYLVMKDSLSAAKNFLFALDKGLDNPQLAREIEQIFLKSGDNENAKKARVFGL